MIVRAGGGRKVPRRDPPDRGATDRGSGGAVATPQL